MKHYILIDLQNTFNIKNVSNIDFKNINNFIKDLDLLENKLTIVYDYFGMQDINISENIFEYLEKYKTLNESLDYLFAYNLDYELIHTLEDSILNPITNRNIVLQEKEYGYLRASIDYMPETMFFVSKTLLILDEKYPHYNHNNIEEFKSIVENDNQLKLLVNLIKKELNFDIKDVFQLFEENWLPFENFDRYKHIDKNDEIILIGGSGKECLFEEYLFLKTLGYTNITVDTKYIYGNDPYQSINMVETQIEKIMLEEFKYQSQHISEINNKNIINDKLISRN